MILNSLKNILKMCKASHITKMDVIKITKSNCTFAGKDLHF